MRMLRLIVTSTAVVAVAQARLDGVQQADMALRAALAKRPVEALDIKAAIDIHGARASASLKMELERTALGLEREAVALRFALAKAPLEAKELGAHAYLAHSAQGQLDDIAGSLDFILVTLATQEQVDFGKFFPLLRPHGALCFVGMCPPITADVFTLGFTMNSITTSNTGGRKEMVQMLEFCAKHSIGATVVTRPMSQVNECLAELESAKHAKRFVLTQ